MIPVYNDICELPCGRLSDLPEEEQDAFSQQLYGQTRPLVRDKDGKPMDYFYMCDYLDWKAGNPVWD